MTSILCILSWSVYGPIPPKSINRPKNNEELESASTSTIQMAPITKEEWTKQQSVIRKIFDPDTGRQRLIKGDGEILEEIVSKEKHKEINKQATLGDGYSFQSQLGLKFQ